MAEKNKKIAVIGASIIGLYAALKLQKKGFDVSVFEKNDRVGGKLCSALISKRIEQGLTIPQGLHEREVNNILVHFPKQDIRVSVNPSFLQFERRKLDEYIFNLAKEQGVKFFFNTEIKEIPQGFFKVIACDGSLSELRKLTSKDSPSFRLGIQYFVERRGQEEQIEIWPKVFSNNEYGFLWKIPGKEFIEYGGIGQAGNVLEELINLLDRNNIVFDRSKIKSALIPQGLCFSKDNNVFLLGDSAGMTKPTTGGGVIWGMTATNILINNFSDFKRAEKKIKRFFKPKILKGKLEVKAGYFIGEKLSLLLPKNFSIDADLF
ncbi:NAD(P)/FAD-dependent oxidoreductase [Patescibacteria group bacterium]|nr:NAD(P)/FAD-dependent oxidoreductase [Patescibacteria group bacterium]MBU4078339.1 NAD(P)/FAD-dependent oxidoreductase [Patescibacteria group bacterium]